MQTGINEGQNGSVGSAGITFTVYFQQVGGMRFVAVAALKGNLKSMVYDLIQRDIFF